tara:strand:+ start:598 stop:888 length:291 start_codon:yes stop_codon:yes gene_type:complete
MKKYYTIFVTEESDYHCEKVVAWYEADENLNSKDIFDLYLKQRREKNSCWSQIEGKIPDTNTSYEVEGITVSDSPVKFMSFDELTHDPSNRLEASV